jgi:hypothetical protein
MNSVGILKFIQFWKLFKIFKYSFMQSLDIFRTWEDSVFGFTKVSWFQLVGNLLTGPSLPINDPVYPFNRAPQLPVPRRPPQSRSPSGDRAHGREAAGVGHCWWPLPHVGCGLIASHVAEHSSPSSISLPRHRSHPVTLCSALLHFSVADQFTIEHHHRPPPSPFEWRIASAVVPSSSSTPFQLK